MVLKYSLIIILVLIAVVASVLSYLSCPLIGVLILFIGLVVAISFAEKLHLKKVLITFPIFLFAFVLYLTGAGIGPESLPHILYTAAVKIHLGLFVFLLGLFFFVNCINYSGIINDMSWRIAKFTRGNLRQMIVLIILLTAVCSGIFDGATVASIMGMVTLTILLNGNMPKDRIFGFMLIIVIGTNIGGVWFVLGEPTNILAARNLGLSPFFFLQYLVPFTVLAVLVSIFYAMRICPRSDLVDAERPDLEVLLEGLSLKRIHAGQNDLIDTLMKIGRIELFRLEKIRDNMKNNMSEVEAVFAAGVPMNIVYEALVTNLNSEEIANGLIEYWHAKNEKRPIANILVGDLLQYVRNEYRERQSSRYFIVAGMVILLVILMIHSVIPEIPSFIAPFVASVVALIGVRKNTRAYIYKSTMYDLKEILFLAPIFGIISLFEGLGGFEIAKEWLLSLSWPVEVVAALIMFFSSSVSAFADNIAVMDFISRGIDGHPSVNLYAVSVIYGTALGGFCSPIASVQAIILATIMNRVKKYSFLFWLKKVFWLYLVFLVSGIALLIICNSLGFS